jgi:hypothetical protein
MNVKSTTSANQKINTAFKANANKNTVSRVLIVREQTTATWTQKIVIKLFVLFVTIWKNHVTLTGLAKLILAVLKMSATSKQRILTALQTISTVF